MTKLYALSYLLNIAVRTTILAFMIVFGVLAIKDYRRNKKQKTEAETVDPVWVKPIGEKYANGQPIPSWVKNEYYIAADIKDGKVLITKPVGWVYANEAVVKAKKEAET